MANCSTLQEEETDQPSTDIAESHINTEAEKESYGANQQLIHFHSISKSPFMRMGVCYIPEYQINSALKVEIEQNCLRLLPLRIKPRNHSRD